MNLIYLKESLLYKKFIHNSGVNLFKKSFLILLLLVTILLAYMLIEPYWIETKEITIESDQIPAQFDVRRLFFSQIFMPAPISARNE